MSIKGILRSAIEHNMNSALCKYMLLLLCFASNTVLLQVKLAYTKTN